MQEKTRYVTAMEAYCTIQGEVNSLADSTTSIKWINFQRVEKTNPDFYVFYCEYMKITKNLARAKCVDRLIVKEYRKIPKQVAVDSVNPYYDPTFFGGE